MFAVFVDDDELDSGGMARSSFGRTPVAAAAAGGGGWVAVDADGGEREAAEAADPLRDADGSLRLHRRRTRRRLDSAPQPGLCSALTLRLRVSINARARPGRRRLYRKSIMEQYSVSINMRARELDRGEGLL